MLHDLDARSGPVYSEFTYKEVTFAIRFALQALN